MSRAPKSIRTVPDEPDPLLVGIDSLYLGYFLDGLGIDWEGLRYEQEKLKANGNLEYAQIRIGDESFALRRGGRKPYSFVLKNRSFELRLGERIQPRCFVQVSSEQLWRGGLYGTLERLETLWRAVGTRQIRPATVSRVDAAFDFRIGEPDFTVESFVSTADKDAIYRERRQDQSFRFGTSDILVRVYDKVAEIEQESDKRWFFDLWGTSSGVWRFEFQLRGERLKEFGIRTLDQLSAYLPGAVRHIAKGHTSLRNPTSDSNRSRWPMHPVWRAIIRNADRLTTRPERPPPPLLENDRYRLERQIKSLEGDLKGIVATLGRNCPERILPLEQLLNWLPRKMLRNHSRELWTADVADKIRKRGYGL